MYKAAAVSQVAADTCRFIKDRLCGVTTPFDLAGCTERLKPLSHHALGELGGCMTTIRAPSCQKAYETCFHRVSSY
jgi:hypothetical protein